jgi:hypothetical protein
MAGATAVRTQQSRIPTPPIPGTAPMKSLTKSRSLRSFLKIVLVSSMMKKNYRRWTRSLMNPLSLMTWIQTILLIPSRLTCMLLIEIGRLLRIMVSQFM